MAQSPDPKQNMAGEQTQSTDSKQNQESSNAKSVSTNKNNETFGNEPEVNDPELPEQPDKYEVNNSKSTPRREDMH